MKQQYAQQAAARRMVETATIEGPTGCQLLHMKFQALPLNLLCSQAFEKPHLFRRTPQIHITNHSAAP